MPETDSSQSSFLMWHFIPVMAYMLWLIGETACGVCGRYCVLHLYASPAYVTLSREIILLFAGKEHEREVGGLQLLHFVDSWEEKRPKNHQTGQSACICEIKPEKQWHTNDGGRSMFLSGWNLKEDLFLQITLSDSFWTNFNKMTLKYWLTICSDCNTRLHMVGIGFEQNLIFSEVIF